MSRFLTNDFVNRDPRALLNTGKMATLAETAIPIKQYITVTGSDTLQIEEGCIFSIFGGGVFKTDETALSASDLDTGSAFTVGKDYYIYLCDGGEGNDEVYKISMNATYPNGYGAANSRKIGGFHYGKCRKVNAALAPLNASDAVRGANWESSVFDGIVPRSVWTLAHRPKCDPEGMVYLSNGTWVDIYLSSDDGAGGLASAYNATPLTGTEGLNWYDFVERALVVGKRLLTYEEFCMMAYGSPGGLADSNTNAWTASSNKARQKTGYVANAVSSVGCRDAVGNVWEWLNELITRAEHTKINGSGTFGTSDGARAGKQYTNGNGHYHATNNGVWGWDTFSPFPEGYGNIYQYNDYSLVALLGGGGWGDGTRAGARAVDLSDCPWYVRTTVGARLSLIHI